MDFIKNNVTIDKDTGCWNWNKSVTSAGYGQFKRDKNIGLPTHSYMSNCMAKFLKEVSFDILVTIEGAVILAIWL